MEKLRTARFASLLVLGIFSLPESAKGAEAEPASTAEPKVSRPAQVSSYKLRISTTQRGLAALPKGRPGERTDRKSDSEVSRATIDGALSSPPSRAPGDEVPGYQGTIIELDRGAKGEALRVQEHFASILARTDPCPKERTTHFDWRPHYIDHPVWNLGWRGDILETKPTSEGGWLIKVRFYPSLYSHSLRTLILDNVQETYRLKGDVIELVASDASALKKPYQHFPMAF